MDHQPLVELPEEAVRPASLRTQRACMSTAYLAPRQCLLLTSPTQGSPHSPFPSPHLPTWGFPHSLCPSPPLSTQVLLTAPAPLTSPTWDSPHRSCSLNRWHKSCWPLTVPPILSDFCSLKQNWILVFSTFFPGPAYVREIALYSAGLGDTATKPPVGKLREVSLRRFRVSSTSWCVWPSTPITPMGLEYTPYPFAPAVAPKSQWLLNREPEVSDHRL